MTPFVVFDLSGADAQKFLQGQLTCDVTKLTATYQATAISNLKGRVAFGLWINKTAASDYQLVISEDCANDFAQHIKKYAAFSKVTLSAPRVVSPVIVAGVPSFAETSANPDNRSEWQQLSIATGNSWIVKATQGLWQPQELRLHQRGGVDYDKGCYLGQEIIARLYFKASPKAWLHRVSGTGAAPQAGEKIGAVDVVNSVATDSGFEGLVVARPDDIAASGLVVLPLPDALEQPVARVH